MRSTISLLSALLLASSLKAENSSPESPSLLYVKDASLTPNGETLWFSWGGDLWSVPSKGGLAIQQTFDPANETKPLVSPDGKWVAYLKEIDKARQIHLLSLETGAVRKLTSHSEGYALYDWYPDGKALLAGVRRDDSWKRNATNRIFRIEIEDSVKGVARERMLMDDYGLEGAVAPNGQDIYFIREGEAWWRQNYVGSQGGQIWRTQGERREKLLADYFENRWPLPAPDGGYYFVSNRSGSSNLWLHKNGNDRKLTDHQVDSIAYPSLSKDGSKLVYRHGLDLYSLHLKEASPKPQKIEIKVPGARLQREAKRPRLSLAQSYAVTDDGLQIAFVAGGDIWVMDTVLREPRRVTFTVEEERDPVFSKDGKELWYVSDREGQTDIWKATSKDAKQFLWEADAYVETRITQDTGTESKLRFSPDGKRILWFKDRGDIWMADAKGQNIKKLLDSWLEPQLDFSPDGSWIVASLSDEAFNRDIWVVPTDGSSEPQNVSLHPFNDEFPKWSPDGKRIAWIGTREEKQADIFYAWLKEEDAGKSERDRNLVKAKDKFKPLRKNTAEPKPAAKAPPAPPKPAASPSSKASDTANPPAAAPIAPPTSGAKVQSGDQPKPSPTPAVSNPAASTPAPSKLKLDLTRIEDRTYRINIPNSREGSLVWSPDSTKLAFSGTVEGRAGTYTVSPSINSKPVLLSTTRLNDPMWLKKTDTIFGLSDKKIASISSKGAVTFYPFTVNHSVDPAAYQVAVFDQCWRNLRDKFYDDTFNKKNWDEIRKKYRAAAAQAPNEVALQDVILMMMGELNASHMGFSNFAPRDSGAAWKEETAHLGVLFDPNHAGKGWKVRTVLPLGPTSKGESKLHSGDVIIEVDHQEVHSNDPLAAHLNGPLDRDIPLKILDVQGKERSVTVRPINYQRAREFHYKHWVQVKRKQVEEWSKGRLGYLHIASMDQQSFNQFQADLYRAGAGKKGLIIDVRENGGGSTTDILLTSLTQPRHAITLARGGAAGYPQDRMVFASWDKPILVLCNQNSFSNAEVFSHAMKTLKRGKLVGVKTAGGVISTGSITIMDAGIMRMPFRGFYHIETGEDYERNGAVPDFVVWPAFEEESKGLDSQLSKGIELLLQDVDAWLKTKLPVLKKASDAQ